ncbi:hypothetical protein BG015_010604 [Linnemannia schmuckeri]|uniref:Uncharacterized protein n=1 Tax=Linnemannia schmuckeri TaxID=64567 RepID=A0A9P5RVX5_9FUNG|nr:hypothetical protein BG015_010604 [Linnemannia schmuckeri]
MSLPPEILEQIGPHLDTHDDRISWRRLFKPANYQGHHTHSCPSHGDKEEDDGEPGEQRNFRIRQLQKYGRRIRHVSLYDSWSIGLLLQAKVVTQLRSLTIFGYRHSAHTGLSADILIELAQDVPAHLFKKMVHDSSSVALARACWQLIINNPGLTSVRLMSLTVQSMSFFDTHHTVNSNGEGDTTASDIGNSDLLLTPTYYLINVVSNHLPRLSHLRLTPSHTEWLLPALANSLLPTIRSYVYSNGDMTTLDNLKLEMWNCLADLKDPHLLPYNQSTPRNSTKSSNGGSSPMELIIHTGMEHIQVSEIHDLLRAQVHFPNLKTFGPIGEIVDLRQLPLILRSFPALEHLMAFYLKGQDSDRDSKLPIEKEPNWKLKTLILRANQFRPRTMTRILAKMPYLVRPELRSLTPDTLAHLAAPGQCQFLEHIRFNLRQPCYGETNRLLVVCPNLRSIQGLGIAVLAEGMITEPRWTCLRLQKFHCEIHGVPRLDHSQEAQLNAASDDNDGNKQQLLELHQRSLPVQ